MQLRHAAVVDLLTTTGIRTDELCSADRGELRRTRAYTRTSRSKVNRSQLRGRTRTRGGG